MCDQLLWFQGLVDVKTTAVAAATGYERRLRMMADR